MSFKQKHTTDVLIKLVYLTSVENIFLRSE